MSDTRQQVLERLRSLIHSGKTNGGIVSTATIQKTLLSEFPDNDIPAAELHDLVAAEATKVGVAVAFEGPE